MHDHNPNQISGYDYGSAGIARSPLSIEELRELEQTVGWSEVDAEVLQRHLGIFEQHAEEMVEVWREAIGSQPHLVKWFFGPDGKRDAEYAAKVKPRFVQWVLDVALRPHDRAWLDYQEEIGLRHTPAKKNKTDGRQTPPLVPLRFLLAFVPVVTMGARPFFVRHANTEHELRELKDAWSKAVQLYVVLWARPYAKEGMW
jgi:hypothetical protein